MSMTEHKSISHDGKHTACQLCQKSNAKMKNPNQMKMQPQFKEAYAWLVRHNPTIDNMACICLPCIKQIQRNHMKEFTPRWLPKAPVPAQACNLQHCKYKVYAKTTLVTVQELETILNRKINGFIQFKALSQKGSTFVTNQPTTT